MKILPGTVQKLKSLFPEAESSVAFANKVKKHLDDYKKGKGNLSLDTASKLSKKFTDIGLTLGSLDPKALRSYSSYASALTYNQKARYTEGISIATKTTVALENLNVEA